MRYNIGIGWKCYPILIKGYQNSAATMSDLATYMAADDWHKKDIRGQIKNVKLGFGDNEKVFVKIKFNYDL